MQRFACLAAQAGDAASFGCACAACQEAWKPLAAAGPDPAPASAPGDVPNDTSTSFAITLGTPLYGALEEKSDHDWYAVDLVAGARYRITLDGALFEDYGALEDPYIYLRDANGTLIDEDDDGGPGRYSLLNWIATGTGRYYLDVGAWNEDYVGGYRLTISAYNPPNYSLDQIADFLTTGYWGNGGHRWDTSADNIVTYNITALTVAGQTLARAAFQAWANVTNLVFQEVESGGDIPFDDNEPGAFAGGNWEAGLITSMRVNVSTAWLSSYGTALDSYSFQTYVHEIGHALGLGHGGPYNGSANYGQDNLYVNDVWSYTVMSYFDQAETGFGSYRYVMGPSIADILAVQNLYGANTSFNVGNTVYGRNATAGSLYDFASYTTAPAFSIYDAGGADTLDASGYSANQIINLNPEAFSSIGGMTNNIAIARNVIIEAAIGGDGPDSLLGNTAANLLSGNAGADTLDGGAENDILSGGAGDDRLIGGAGLDVADYQVFGSAIFVNLNAGTASGSDIGADLLLEIEGAAGGQGADSIIGNAADIMLSGNAGADTLVGGAGNDSLYGGAGDDLLMADGLGNCIDGGAGDDVILLGGVQPADLLALFAINI
ncbi:MAG: M10 family metallopeptidase C-terminal domain-containing protein [Roseomonas sp.]|nr:M10 family metallopeptidase C-terminal domain-containing protein [Roseomonas sp.]MCA3328135.1 M10 family metallopeptidase C-terminal domain-containing protein [Roseomonas sp.]MCA3332644.1 M10 family metallopeptidase C-terminal domain-containing protein [Roseomonas sp.]MCA3336200.1 M10 family metallopeptidase C-terminal domain-containing protein [Roseomonas sp.]MCA3356306.1 M10 family metallopeptidase C-terminal domain-containing protein [Roseomonas sp.]